MKISIITATYNSQNFIASCLDSISFQTYKNIEHVIIDGKSNDKTLEIINKHPFKPVKVVSEKDRGIYDALNKGIKNATGDIIGFLHSDDIFKRSDTLELIANTFNKTGADIVYGDLEYMKDFSSKKVFRLWKSAPFKQKKLLHGWMPPHPTILARKEIYEEIGGFDPSFKIAGDYKFILQMFSNESLKSIYIPQVITQMKVGGKSNKSLSNIILKMKEDWLALDVLNIGSLRKIYVIFLKNFSKISQLFIKKLN